MIIVSELKTIDDKLHVIFDDFPKDSPLVFMTQKELDNIISQTIESARKEEKEKITVEITKTIGITFDKQQEIEIYPLNHLLGGMPVNEYLRKSDIIDIINQEKQL